MGFVSRIAQVVNRWLKYKYKKCGYKWIRLPRHAFSMPRNDRRMKAIEDGITIQCWCRNTKDKDEKMYKDGLLT